MPIRVLTITDQADFGRVLEHHITVFWDDADVRFHSPALQGVFDPAFSAAGYDIVVLDGECAPAGTGWLRDLSSRPEFPPIVYFSDKIGAATAIEQGALALQPREHIDH